MIVRDTIGKGLDWIRTWLKSRQEIQPTDVSRTVQPTMDVYLSDPDTVLSVQSPAGPTPGPGPDPTEVRQDVDGTDHQAVWSHGTWIQPFRERRSYSLTSAVGDDAGSIMFDFNTVEPDPAANTQSFLYVEEITLWHADFVGWFRSGYYQLWGDTPNVSRQVFLARNTIQSGVGPDNSNTADFSSRSWEMEKIEVRGVGSSTWRGFQYNPRHPIIMGRTTGVNPATITKLRWEFWNSGDIPIGTDVVAELAGHLVGPAYNFGSDPDNGYPLGGLAYRR